MQTRVLSAASLDREQLQRWSEIQRSCPSLASPFFRPEYASLVAAAGEDVKVALLESSAGPAGFFPFQLGHFGVGRPAGSLITDYHGVIAGEGVDVKPLALLRACGMKSWSFHHVPAAQQAFAPFSRSSCESAVMDLSEGFEGYVRGRHEHGSHAIRSLGQKAHKLEREHGPISYVHHSTDPDVLALLMRWKQHQYHQTGALDPLARGWVRRVLELVHRAQGESFAGVLSMLCTEDRPVAVHLGLRSETVMHSWFPAYDHEFARYSPGQLLFLELAKHAPESGIRAIDLGPAEGQHKRTMTSAGAPLLEGAVEVPSLTSGVLRASRAARKALKRTPLGPSLQTARRRLEALRAPR
jgi:CelD/BcsL family acetyltransferase involved in cellulose biosynthesis